MMNESAILMPLLLLGGIGVVGALLLYLVARRFHVEEDPAVEQVEALLPGANCGACGCKGCHDFAVTACARRSLDGLVCPGAAPGAMDRVAEILGVSASATEARVAVLHCNGSCEARPRPFRYDGAESCAVMAAVGAGTSACSYGCLGCGDCVSVCRFGALSMNPETMLPEVDTERCTGCNACVKECPRGLFDLRPRGPRGLRVWVACNNRQRGAVARKACSAACIACTKCYKACTHGAINISENLSYIDPGACRLCGKCVDECPTGAILTTLPKFAKKS